MVVSNYHLPTGSPKNEDQKAESSNQVQSDTTDVFLSHDWGTDEQGRNNHDRVSVVNDALKQLGYKTWFDSDRMTGDIIDKMCDGIDKTKLIIVFVTQRYAQKVQSGSDNDNCKLEFKYAMRRKGAGNMVPVIMEERMKNPGVWEGPVGMALGGILAVRMFTDFGETDTFRNGMSEIKQEIDARLRKLEAVVPDTAVSNITAPVAVAPVPEAPVPVPVAPVPVPAPTPVQPPPPQPQPASNNVLTIPRISKGRIKGAYSVNLKKLRF